MPDIVYVDDEDPKGFLSNAEENSQSDRFQPFRMTERGMPAGALEAAQAAETWVFDFFLANPQGDGDNGLSLFAKWRQKYPDHPPVVLISSDLKRALGEEPLESDLRHHVLAERFGVEWIGAKDRATFKRCLVTASATASLRAELDKAAVEQADGRFVEAVATDHLVKLLLGDRDHDMTWTETAKRQVDAARPPRLMRASRPKEVARLLIRWLIGNVLPFSSFLLSDAQAALRLGLGYAAFEKLANGDVPELAKCLYTGPLADFHGRRWWRAGLDDWAFELEETGNGYRTAMEQRFGSDIGWLEQANPVLVSDADLVETGDVKEAAECVRAADEDFPSGVDPAWVTIEEARLNRKLAAKVLADDQYLLEPDEEA